MSTPGCPHLPESNSTFVLRRAGAVVVDGQDGTRTVETAVDVAVDSGRVAAIGNRCVVPPGTREIDAADWLVIPGFVNAHHHLSQQLTRTRACGGSFLEWLTALYPTWSLMDDELVYHAARIGVAELMLCGATTISDFSYFFPRGQERMADALVRAAMELGCRFLFVRGGISELEAGVQDALGGSLAPALESRETLLNELERVVTTYHDPSPESFCRVAAGLTEKAYGDPELMLELAVLAERRDIRLHTHFHPRLDERDHAQATIGKRPLEFLEDVGWCSHRLWVAHGSRLDDSELLRFKEHGVGLCTCPSSNARFGTPIAPAYQFHRVGGQVGIGVDGAASNDSADFVGEARLTLQVQRIRAAANGIAPGEISPELVLEWGTLGGARVLGWPEIGRLSPGSSADLACFDLASIDYVGADDPVAALFLCGLEHRAILVSVAGVITVEQGHLTSHDEDELYREARLAESELMRRAGRL